MSSDDTSERINPEACAGKFLACHRQEIYKRLGKGQEIYIYLY
jgi:hypothetical protein